MECGTSEHAVDCSVQEVCNTLCVMVGMDTTKGLHSKETYVAWWRHMQPSCASVGLLRSFSLFPHFSHVSQQLHVWRPLRAPVNRRPQFKSTNSLGMRTLTSTSTHATWVILGGTNPLDILFRRQEASTKNKKSFIKTHAKKRYLSPVNITTRSEVVHRTLHTTVIRLLQGYPFASFAILCFILTSCPLS